jgi:hypothetical protein
MRTSPAATVVGVALSALALLLIAGHGPWAGPTLIDVSQGHGLNVGDVPVLGAWVAGLVALRELDRSGRVARSRVPEHD